MVNDWLSDFVVRIKNGYRSGAKSVETPATKMITGVAKVLVEEGYLKSVKTEKNILTAELKYDKKEPAITGIARVSKPGVRIYSGIKNLPRVLGGLGINILSTPKGILSEKKAKKLNTGGEVIAKVW